MFIFCNLITYLYIQNVPAILNHSVLFFGEKHIQLKHNGVLPLNEIHRHTYKTKTVHRGSHHSTFN